ncbi:hypothetical protein E3983_01155 [Legionella israelensis]|uniref:Uncharacterized protein n=1 Tax=Legionella israelensis TaxID=454 RepID=A0AAX1EDN2_9GAMM|nr:hypothetical protein [Legionella israelensis]QBR83087.1 hypothetical protein E3983_01155 [Legionella israelensis]
MTKEKRLLQKELPRLNYLWIGSPKMKSSYEGAVLASDVENVIEMAKNCNNPVCYYCLDEYKDFYENLFEEQGVDITVVSVDAYLEEMSLHEDEEFRQYAEQMLAMKHELLNPPRDRIIDRVSFKDAFSLLLLATQGNYTLDTNVKIIDGIEDKVTFDAYDAFKIPYVNLRHSINPDCWMMYASPQALEEPKKMLDYYLSNWDKVQEKIRGNERDIDHIYKYHWHITTLMIGSVYEGLCGDDRRIDPNKYDKDWEFSFVRLDSLRPKNSERLSVEKHYANSHKPWHECLKNIENDFTVIQSENATYKKYKIRNELIETFRGMLEKEKEKALRGSVPDMHTIKLLDNVLKKIIFVDQHARILREVSSDYKSKNKKKQKYANEIFKCINEMYLACDESLFFKRVIEQSSLEDIIGGIKGILEEACAYHHDRHSFFKEGVSRFENCKALLQELTLKEDPENIDEYSYSQ